MAIGAGAAGAWAASNATTQTVTLPAHATGDLLLLIAAAKAAAVTSVNPIITTGAGWLRVASFADGTTNAGNGTGSVRQAIFYKVALSASETSPIIDWGTTSAPGLAVALGFTKGSGESWYIPVVEQKATNAATSISVTMDANPGITAGDWGVVVHTTADDAALTVPTWTATGTTLAAVVEYPATAIASGTSNDMAGDAAYRSVTSGTASSAPVVTGTQATAETGVTAFIRLRVGTTPSATTIYPTNTASAVSTASTDYEAWTSRGGGNVSATAAGVTGPTAPIQLSSGGAVVDWFTKALTAFTLSGPVYASVRPALTVNVVNGALILEIARVDGDGTNASVWVSQVLGLVSQSAANDKFLVTAADMAITAGQRLRIRCYADDGPGTTMASGGNVALTFNGVTLDATGDFLLIFGQALTEAAAGPVDGTGAGSQTTQGATGAAAETFTGTGAGGGTAGSATGSAVETIEGSGAGTQALGSATGPGLETISGTGAGTQTAPTASGAGIGGPDAITGTGAGAGTASTSSGAALETFTGTGTATQAAQTAAGDGTSLVAVTGTGAAAQVAQTATGTGVGGIEPVTATGAGSQVVQAASGSALETMAATGAGTQTTQTATGSGLETITGSGAGSQAVQTASGSGASLLAVTGTGAGAQAIQTAEGTGLQLQAVTGTGAGTQVPQSGYGVGIGGISTEQPPSHGHGPPLGAARITGPAGEKVRVLRPVTGTGHGEQAAASASGTGFVNDDELVLFVLEAA